MGREAGQIHTIDDIARALGLSKSTVSRAISGKGRISDATRRRVADFITEHNYRPNAVARGLALSRSGNIALVMPDNSMDSSFFAACMRGVCAAATERDFDVIVAADDGLRQMERILANRKVDGVIATRSVRNSPIISLLKAQNMPYVIIGASCAPSVVSVDSDNRGGSRALCALMLRRGMRRLALLGGDEDYLVTRSRLDGFLDAHREFGLDAPETVYLNICDNASASAAVEDALAHGVQALICMDGFISNLAMIQLAERNISVPRQMRVASLYDSAIMEHLIPAVTSLSYDAQELGREACQALFSLLDGTPPARRILPGYRLIERGSTR